jgi:uncharacterized flavoprotein (TIGR03862 family)
MSKEIAIVGSGPAGLMAADYLATKGYKVVIFEKRAGIGRKLYIAGASGLNITNSAPLDEFVSVYVSNKPDLWKKAIHDFPPQAWIQFIEEKLQETTFLGTSGRYFVKSMTAAKLVKNWKKRLVGLGVAFKTSYHMVDLKPSTNLDSKTVLIHFNDHEPHQADAVVLALGGGSYEEDLPITWPDMLRSHQIEVSNFEPSNSGWHVNFPKGFLDEAAGQPLKNINFRSSRGAKLGDLVVTSYGLEGTPVYFLGEVGQVILDLKPDLTEDQVLSRLKNVKENFSPIKRVKKTLKLCSASEALLYHFTKELPALSLESLSKLIKNFPLELLSPRPLSESISSSGGVSLDEVSVDFMLHRLPGVFVAGEMLDFDAPTGGYLIQGCISTAVAMCHGIEKYLGE